MSRSHTAVSAIPAAFRGGIESEFGVLGQRWLDALPWLLDSVCAEWDLSFVEITPKHGYLSLVWHVTSNDASRALKVTPPSDMFEQEIAGLVAWAGRRMVSVDKFDTTRGVALLEWLDDSVSLTDQPLNIAISIAGSLLTPIAIGREASDVGYTNAYTEAELSYSRWTERGPSLGAVSQAAYQRGTRALTRARRGQASPQCYLVNHDLHYDNVVRDWMGRWTCIDPKPLLGPPEYAIGPLIWRRYKGPAQSVERVKKLCSIANLDRFAAFDWLLVRLIGYQYWAIEAGLTLDPQICQELIRFLTGDSAPD